MFILFDQGRPLASFGSDIPRCVSDSELPGRGDVSRQIMADPLNRAMLLGDDAIPAAAALRRHVAEGVRVFEHYRPKENPILNPNPARLRRDGVVTLVLSLFVVVVCGALPALILGAPIPAFLVPDSMRIEKPPDNEAVSIVGPIVLLGFFIVTGLVGSIAGLWLIIFRKRHTILTKIMWAMLWLFFVGGTLLQLAYLWIKPE